MADNLLLDLIVSALLYVFLKFCRETVLADLIHSRLIGSIWATFEHLLQNDLYNTIEKHTTELNNINQLELQINEQHKQLEPQINENNKG